ncbi:MAG TPA: MFS transporter [Burkholderiales bacterium]|nr:MFS transporter [Burkholderiales bacterium]
MASPFSVRSFRFQWPADLATSWAFEMEALILGWYVLSSTGSVQQLAALAALAWLGSLFSPFFGLAGDRLGHRTVLCMTRGGYALLAAVMTALTLTDTLQPWHVFAIAAIAGLMRPSDMVMRSVLVGQTMGRDMLLGALGLSRTTSDTARVAGALAGAGVMALIGMGAAYAMVTAMYVAAVVLTFGVAGRPATHTAPEHPLSDLKDGFRYAWHKPDLLATFAMAFLVNLLAYPFVLGLLPYVAKEIYGAGQAVLAYLVASFWTGALVGSLVVGAGRLPFGAARTMLWSAGLWFAATLLFGQTATLGIGIALLFFAGLMQSFCLTPLAAIMLRTSDESMRGRVMGVRMLAIWGLPLGLVVAGPLIEWIGYAATSFIYNAIGLAATIAIGWRWRDALWHRSAAANVA